MRTRVFLAAMIGTFLVFALGAARVPADDVPVYVDRTVEGRDVDRWRELALERDRTARRQAQTIRRLRVALRRDPEIVEAINLAAVTYGVSGALMFHLARCESRLNPNARNRTSTATGLFQHLYPSTWRTTPYARFSPYSPYASAMAAAQMISRGRRGEWVC